MQKDILQDLTKCTVAIRNSIGDNILGTGVIVTDDGLIVTCYHVIGDIKTKTLPKTVHIYFPSIPEFKGRANILNEYCNPSSDIAFLQLEGKLPEQVTIPAILSESVIRIHNYQSLGFRESDNTKIVLSDKNKLLEKYAKF